MPELKQYIDGLDITINKIPGMVERLKEHFGSDAEFKPEPGFSYTTPDGTERIEVYQDQLGKGGAGLLWTCYYSDGKHGLLLAVLSHAADYCMVEVDAAHTYQEILDLLDPWEKVAHPGFIAQIKADKWDTADDALDVPEAFDDDDFNDDEGWPGDEEN